MPGSSQALIRSVASSPIGGAYVANASSSPFMPLDVVTCRPHLIEDIDIPPISGTAQPGGSLAFDLSLEVDLITKLNLRVRLSALDPSGTTFYRWANFVGLNMISEVRLRFGTEKLQTVHRDEIFAKIHSYYPDEEKANLQRLCGGLTEGERDDRAANEQEIVVPLLTLLGVHLFGDPSQALFVRGLGEKIRLEVDLASFDTLVESDITSPTTPATPFTYLSLFAEGQHIYEAERRMLEKIYAAPRTYTFDEFQTSSVKIIDASETLDGNVIQVPLDGFNQPTQAMYVFMRWTNDLTRTVGGATNKGVRGRDYWNVAGWYNPDGGPNRPMVKTVSVKVGANAYMLKPTAVETLMDYEHTRSWKGSNPPAVLKWTWSHDPTRENAVLVSSLVWPCQQSAHHFFVGLPRPVADGPPGTGIDAAVGRCVNDRRRRVHPRPGRDVQPAGRRAVVVEEPPALRQLHGPPPVQQRLKIEPISSPSTFSAGG